MNDLVFSAMIDRKFKRDKNPHKFAILWTSKFFRNVNKSMRQKMIQINKIISLFISLKIT